MLLLKKLTEADHSFAHLERISVKTPHHKIDRSQRSDDFLKVRVCFFGAPETFIFQTVNISLSGLLLICPEKISFQNVSLLEVFIDPDNEKIGTVKCLAKIIRVAKVDSQLFKKYKKYLSEVSNIHCLIGINIVEMDEKNQQRWESYLTKKLEPKEQKNS